MTGRMHRLASTLTHIIAVAAVSLAVIGAAIPQPFDIGGLSTTSASTSVMTTNQYLLAQGTTASRGLVPASELTVAAHHAQADGLPAAGEERRPQQDRRVTLPGIRETFPDLFLPRPNLALLRPVEQRQIGPLWVSWVFPTFSMNAFLPLCEVSFIEAVALTYSFLSQVFTLCLEAVVDHEPVPAHLYMESATVMTIMSWWPSYTHVLMQAGMGRTMVFRIAGYRAGQPGQSVRHAPQDRPL